MIIQAETPILVRLAQQPNKHYRGVVQRILNARGRELPQVDTDALPRGTTYVEARVEFHDGLRVLQLHRKGLAKQADVIEGR